MSLCKIIKYMLVFSVLLISACVQTKVVQHPVPDGFARYEKEKGYKAVSPEGVVYRVRYEENKPYAELSFWKEALKKRMLDAGYIFLSESDIKAGEDKGYLLELTAPMGEQDFTYLIAVFVKKKEIMIAEAAGEVLLLSKHRKSIVAAIERLTF